MKNGLSDVVCIVQSKWGGRHDMHAWKRLQGFGWCGPDEIWALGTWAWAKKIKDST